MKAVIGTFFKEEKSAIEFIEKKPKWLQERFSILETNEGFMVLSQGQCDKIMLVSSSNVGQNTLF